jgi:hypothetical protein
MIFYSLGKASFGGLAKRRGVSRTTPADWIRPAASSIDAPTSDADIHEMAGAERWPCSQAKPDQSGLVKPWIGAPGEPGPGCSVVVRRQRATGSPTNSNIDRRVYVLQTTGRRLLRSYPRRVIALAKPTRMRLNGIRPIHASISRG